MVMLRITEIRKPGDEAILQLEGEVMGAWVTEVKKACERFVGKGYRLTLDLGDVEYVDRDGVALLGELMKHQVRLVNCSSFLAERLRENSHQRQSS
jgi:ABC-type transporter Mla MlaB component